MVFGKRVAPFPSSRATRFLGVLALVAAVGPVAANPMATYGYTARGIALGGAMTAVAQSFESTWYNPAGLAQVAGLEAGFGLSLRRTFLRSRQSLEDTAAGSLTRVETDHGETAGALDLGLASPLSLGAGLERVLFVGASVMVPGTTLYAIRERPVEQPVFPFLEERNDRMVLNLAVAARCRWAMLGVGVSFLPTVNGRVDVDFTDGDRKNTTAVDVGTSLAPSVGLLVLPSSDWSIGLVWRGENRLDLAIPVSVVISDKIMPIDLKVTAIDYSTPHEVALGVAWKREGWMVAADVTWLGYHRFRASFPEVVLFSSSGDGSAAIQSSGPDAGFHDAWSVRVGGETHLARGFALRVGWSWVQSPVPAQTGLTNLLDGDRHGGSVGFGVDVAALGGPALTFDLALAGGGLVGNRDEKQDFDPGNPGYPRIEGHGGYVVGTLSTAARF